MNSGSRKIAILAGASAGILIVRAAAPTILTWLANARPELLLHTADFVLSVGIVALLFAAMYRFLPNARIEWHDVWFGAIVTSVLFNLGKLVLGLYIGKSAVGSSYGAAGAVLVLLLWVYYSGLIFYLGAEFTKAYADRVGSRKKQVQSKMRSKRAFSYENSSIA